LEGACLGEEFGERELVGGVRGFHGHVRFEEQTVETSDGCGGEAAGLLGCLANYEVG
jgi:hypothetical protein